MLRSHAEMLRLQKSKRKNAKQALEAHAVEHQELKDRLARHRAILEGKAGPQLEIYREGAETALALAVEALGGEVTGIESSRCLRAYIVWWIRSCGARRGAGAAEEEGEEEAPEVRAVAQEIAAGI